MPEPTDKQREEIAEVARILDEQRRNWLFTSSSSEVVVEQRTLTELYNERPTWLTDTHAKLDQAVFAAYGWAADLSDKDVLERLVALNLERSGQA